MGAAAQYVAAVKKGHGCNTCLSDLLGALAVGGVLIGLAAHICSLCLKPYTNRPSSSHQPAQHTSYRLLNAPRSNDFVFLVYMDFLDTVIDPQIESCWGEIFMVSSYC